MNISKDIKPITFLKSRAADLLKQINRLTGQLSLLRMENQKLYYKILKVMRI